MTHDAPKTTNEWVRQTNKDLAVLKRRPNHGPIVKILTTADRHNKLINPGLRTNQDGYVSGTNIPIGSYAFDGWKASGVINLIPNPSAEATLPAYFTQGVTLTKDSTWAQFRTNSFKLVATGASGDSFFSFGENVAISTFGLIPGKTYTVSAYCKVITPTSGTATTPARVRSITMFFNGTGEVNSTQAVNTAGTVTRVSLTFTVPGNTTTVHLRPYLGTTVGTIQWDGFLLTEGPILYPYFDGSTADCSWSGTADASTSYNVPNVVPTLTGTFDPNFGSYFTINANGRIGQIAERSLFPAGAYTVVNGGTAQMRVYNNLTAPASRPAFAAGPVTFVADGTDDVVVEFSGGGSGATIGQVRVFAGSTDYGFALPPIADELRACQRHYRSYFGALGLGTGFVYSSTIVALNAQFDQPMRVIPNVSATGLFNLTASNTSSATGIAMTTQSYSIYLGVYGGLLYFNCTSGMTLGVTVIPYFGSPVTGKVTFDARIR